MGKGEGNGSGEGGLEGERERGQRTAVAGVHVGDEWGAVGIEIGNHLGVFLHVVELGYCEICHA